jgi:DNA modification methylase
MRNETIAIRGDQMKPPCTNPVEMWPIDRPKPHPDNARIHADEQVDQLANSIEAFDMMRTILVDENDFILAGHGLWLAHRRLNRAEIPVTVIRHLSEQQKQLFLVADNQLAQTSEWDEEKLRPILAALEKELGDLKLLGFSPQELDRLLADLAAEAPWMDEDEVPPLQGLSVTRAGDLWALGKHRVLCADATEPGTLQTVLQGQMADMVFTDPPYNCAYRQRRRGRAGQPEGIANDDLGPQFEQFLHAACVELLAVCQGAVYLCMSSAELHTLFKAFTAAGGHWSTFLMWAKDRFTLGRSDYQRQYEPILYGWPEGQQHFWNGARNQGDVWWVPKPKVNRLHPTMKPVSLIERAIRNSSQRGDLVLDPFGGSGSTLIACEKSGRRAAVVELEPKYVDAIIRRWEAYARREAQLESDGRSFLMVAEERLRRAA